MDYECLAEEFLENLKQMLQIPMRKNTDRFVRIVFISQNGVDTLTYQFAEFLLDGDSRYFGLQTTFFAAGADDFVVEEGNVSEFTGESAFAVIELPVHDDADSQTSSQVQVEHIPFVLRFAGGIFCVAAGAGVVFE